RVAVPVTALALVAAIGGAAGFTWQLAEERDRAVAAEARARQAAAFTSSVLENTGANRDAAREVSVQTLLEQAATRVQTELSDEPEVATRMRLAIGTAFQTWGAHDQALQVLQPALAEARARGPAGERDLAEVLKLLATVTHDLGQLETSLDWTRQAESVWRRVGGAGEQAQALSDLALALNGLRRREEAQPVFREALARMRQAHAGDHDDIAWLLNNMAWGLHAMGRLDEAAPLYEQAVAMQRRLGTALVELSQTQHNLAGVHYDRGDLDRAERLWREVLAQFESVYGAGGHAAVARAQNILAVVALDRGQFDAAVQLTGDALATNLRLLGENHRFSAITLQSHGVALLRAGRLDEAGRHLLRAQAARRDLLPPVHADHVGTQLGLARLGLARGTGAGVAQAEGVLREALALIESLPAPDRVPLDDVQLTLARALALQGRREEASQLAAQVVARMKTQVAATHWRRRAAEAVVGLPPFVASAQPGAIALAQQTLEALREQLGPHAPAVQEIEAGLLAAR
ncbi:MAG TPA: tetratricopeptide repeat protein, partial [Rubrivivax sp.]|nr:tetratricopeptide repeat protein [Rubrivivax sp.]